MKLRHAALAAVTISSWAVAAHADGPAGAPPPEAKALVEAPKAPGEEPKKEDKVDGKSITLSAGGRWATGNTRQLAGTANGTFDWRFSNNGVGASILANYAEGAKPGESIQTTAENIQGRVRYDRYVLDNLSLFLIETGRHDRFQGLDYRNNLDPGVKYLFFKEVTNSLWAELGYDFQYDIRRSDSLAVLDASGNPVLDSNGNPTLLDKTKTDHSSRLFAGYKHGFNKEVTLATGLEYLQSFVDTTGYRLNFDALFAAKVGGGLALGLGFSARYDHNPLPGKEKLDTSSTLSLIYAFTDVPEAPKPPMCPCTPTSDTPFPPPPEATPPPAAAPPADSPPPPPASDPAAH